jgi:hypothetical protein
MPAGRVDPGEGEEVLHPERRSRLELLNGDDPTAVVNVRYHPVAT